MNGSTPLIGEGTTQCAVGDREGHVLLQYPRPVQWVALDPQTAVQIAKAMMDAASNCGMNIEIKLPKPVITEGMRTRMEVRAMMILNNKREHTEKTPVLARRMVDTILNILDL